MNIIKKALCLILCFTFLVGTSSNVHAATDNQKLRQTSFSNITAKDLDSMNTDELNAYIDYVKKMYTSHSKKSGAGASVMSLKDTKSLSIAWLAGAKILRQKGYPCAAKALECSVFNKPYNENMNTKGKIGPFAKKIKNTSTYKNYIKNLKKKKQGSYSGSLKFTKGVNEDLFLALHKVSVNTKKGRFSDCQVTITDVYDFAYNSQYKQKLLATVTNAAWLCQHTGVLHPIKIKISFMD